MSLRDAPPVIVGLAVGVSLIIIFGLLSPMDFQSRHEFDAKFAKHRGTMELSLDMNSIGNSSNAESSTQFNRVLNLLANCEYGSVKIFYASGSMEIALNGLDEKQNCPTAIDIIQYNKENILPVREQKFDCSIPIDAMESWMLWTNRAVPSADEILTYCVRV